VVASILYSVNAEEAQSAQAQSKQAHCSAGAPEGTASDLLNSSQTFEAAVIALQNQGSL